MRDLLATLQAIAIVAVGIGALGLGLFGLTGALTSGGVLMTLAGFAGYFLVWALGTALLTK